MLLASLVDRNEIAKELRALAQEAALAARADELRALAASLQTQTDLERWARIDLIAAFTGGRETSGVGSVQTSGKDPAGFRRFLLKYGDTVELLLGALVFLPLLVTWVGLANAAAAYLRLVEDEPQEATRPFLQLWLSGFGGRLAGIFRFYDVALCAVIILSLLLVLAVVHAAMRSAQDRYDVERQKEQDKLQEERSRLSVRLASVLTRTHLVLETHRSEDVNRIGRQLVEVADKLRTLVAETTVAATAAITATNAATAASQAAEASVARLTAGVESVERAQREGASAVTESQSKVADAVTASQAAVAGSLSAAAVTVADAVASSQAGVASAISHSQQKVSEAVSVSQKAVAASVVSSQEQVAVAVQGNATALSGISHAVEGARDAVVGAGESLDVFAQTNGAAADQTRRAADATVVALEEMRQSAEHWDAAAAHWEDAAGGVDQAARSLAEAVSVAGPTGAQRGDRS